jgi:hypothetical protein
VQALLPATFFHTTTYSKVAPPRLEGQDRLAHLMRSIASDLQIDGAKPHILKLELLARGTPELLDAVPSFTNGASGGITIASAV